MNYDTVGEKRRAWLGYGVAVLSVALLTLIWITAGGTQSFNARYTLFLLAVVVSAWYGGVWAGLLALSLSALAGYLLFSDYPEAVLSEWRLSDVISMLVFFVVGGIILWLFQRLRAARQIAEISALESRQNFQKLLHETTTRTIAEASLKLSEKSRRDQQLEMEAIYNTAPIGLAVIDTDMRYVRINNYLAENNGLPAEAHIGRKASEVIPHIAAAADSLLQRVIESGEPLLNQEIRGETPDKPGFERTWIENFFPLKNEMGEVTAVNIVVQEMTDYKRIEQELRDNQRLLERINQTTPALVYIYDIASKRNLYANRKMAEMLGYTPEEAQAMGDQFIDSTIHPADLPSAIERTQQFMNASDDITVESEYQVKHADGSWRWLFCRETVFARNAAGITQQILGIALDVTERKRLEEALRDNQHLMERINNTNPAVIYIYDLIEQRNIYANRELAEIAGYSAEAMQLMGDQLLPSLFHPDDLPLALARLDQFRDTPDNLMIESEYRLKHADGSWRWLFSRETSFNRDSQGATRQILGVALDVTERRQIEDHNRLIGELAASLSASLTLKEIGQVVNEKCAEAFGSHINSLFRLSGNGKMLERLNTTAAPMATSQMTMNYPLDGSFPISDAVREREIIHIKNREDYAVRYPDMMELVEAVGVESTIGIPLRLNAKVIGGLAVSFTSPKQLNDAEYNLLIVFAQLTAQAMERARLSEEAQETAAADERQRLARELHDAVSQVLFAATAMAETIPNQMQRDSVKAMERLDHVITLNRAAMADLRALLLELRPESIIKTDLAVLLTHLIQGVRGRKMIQGKLDERGEPYALPPEVHFAIYRIAQEAMSNLVKHSNAATYTMLLNWDEQAFSWSLQDDGQGFDTAQLSAGLGLGTMQERAQSIDATLTITSAPNAGTRVEVHWPRSEIKTLEAANFA